MAEAWGAGRTLAAVVEGAAWRERAVALGRGVADAHASPRRLAAVRDTVSGYLVSLGLDRRLP